jgi:hypothetical protein
LLRYVAYLPQLLSAPTRPRAAGDNIEIVRLPRILLPSGLSPSHTAPQSPGSKLGAVVAAEVAARVGTLLADKNTDKEHDPYADIIGTC